MSKERFCLKEELEKKTRGGPSFTSEHDQTVDNLFKLFLQSALASSEERSRADALVDDFYDRLSGSEIDWLTQESYFGKLRASPASLIRGVAEIRANEIRLATRLEQEAAVKEAAKKEKTPGTEGKKSNNTNSSQKENGKQLAPQDEAGGAVFLV